jgi:hypothetical protein
MLTASTPQCPWMVSGRGLEKDGVGLKPVMVFVVMKTTIPLQKHCLRLCLPYVAAWRVLMTSNVCD